MSGAPFDVQDAGGDTPPRPSPLSASRGGEGANALRGEASVVLDGHCLVLRPSFAALVAAEAELGPLFALVERAAGGGLSLTELSGLFWHCLRALPDGWTRARFSDALVDAGLAAATPALRVLLGQVLGGR